MSCSRLLGSILLLALALVPVDSRADASVRIRLDWGDPGKPAYDETILQPNRADLDNADDTLTAGELRFAVGTGTADAHRMQLGCLCDSIEGVQALCEATVSRGDFTVTGPTTASVIATFELQVNGRTTFPIVDAEPFPSDTIFFRVDPVGPGSRVEFVEIAGQEPTVHEVNNVDVIDAVAGTFRAAVRRSKLVTPGVPFSLEASLRTICQVAPGGGANGHAHVEASAGSFAVSLPAGYAFAPEPSAIALGIAAGATLAGVAANRRSGRRPSARRAPPAPRSDWPSPRSRPCSPSRRTPPCPRRTQIGDASRRR
jgi:hypothetical protein